MQENADARRLLTEREAAAFLNIGMATLANWRSTGRVVIPCVRLGRAVRYRVSDLEQFIAAQTVGAP
jgi:predicted DNA-binding transcriptional regulator AlpA